MTVVDEVITHECPACGQTVPAATFCGECGAESNRPVTSWTRLLRPRVYAADPREKVWAPFVSSAFFPRFPARQRMPFRLAMILVAVAIITLASLRVNGPLAVTATIGWPLLGVIYLWQSDAYRDIPVRILATVNLLGLVFGVGWWLLAAKILAGTYGVSTGSAFALAEVLDVGWLITAGGAFLMVVPAVVVRMLPMQQRESLDGFVIGSSGALAYWVAAATTSIAPQFAEGLLEEQSAGRMLQDSITTGIVNPIMTTAAGGLIGLRLWFTAGTRPGRDPKRARRALTLLTLLAAPGYLAVWAVDSLGLPRPADMAIKIGLSVLALLTIRCAVQVALLHEQPDPASGAPHLCIHCNRVVPDLPFCSSCGGAARAASRTSRELLRKSDPVPV